MFEDPELDYTEAMLEYVAASQERDEQRANSPDDAQTPVPETPKAEKKALKREEEQLRDERRSVREQRKIEDEAWKETRAARKEEQEAFKELPKEERRQQKAAKEAADEYWRKMHEQRRAKQQQRKEEDRGWRETRNSLREQMSRLPVVMAWVAILVVIDNCTRQCFGLPLFVVGPHVTSEMIVEALESLLPPELQFLISDRGIHFKAGVFKNFLLSKEVIHVLISRQRPETNGIAERFVRTLKDWLEDKTWSSDEELAALLEQFLKEYNDRPHQGLDMPGLSPNEYARRLKLRQPDG